MIVTKRYKINKTFVSVGLSPASLAQIRFALAARIEYLDGVLDGHCPDGLDASLRVHHAETTEALAEVTF